MAQKPSFCCIFTYFVKYLPKYFVEKRKMRTFGNKI